MKKWIIRFKKTKLFQRVAYLREVKFEDQECKRPTIYTFTDNEYHAYEFKIKKNAMDIKKACSMARHLEVMEKVL